MQIIDIESPYYMLLDERSIGLEMNITIHLRFASLNFLVGG
jgi:hypothetical protein